MVLFFPSRLFATMCHILKNVQLASPSSLHSRTFGLWLAAILANREREKQGEREREDKVEHNVLISHFKEGFTYAMDQEGIVLQHVLHCAAWQLLLSLPPLSSSLFPCGTHMWRILNI